MGIHDDINGWAKFIGDDPLMKKMLLESASIHFGKPVEELSALQKVGGHVKLQDYFERKRLENFNLGESA